MGIEEILLNVAFYLFAAGALVAAVAVAMSTNIIRSAFSLLAVLFSVAAMYAFMRADFIVAAQIIIYVGGILVLIIFAVMLTHKITDVKVSNESAPGPAAVMSVVCVLFALVSLIGTWHWDRTPAPDADRRSAVLAGDEKPSTARVEVSLFQGDGATGISPGGMMLGGVGVLRYTVRDAPSRATAAIFELTRIARGRKGLEGDPVSVNLFEVSLVQGAGTGEQRLTGLAPGQYRWKAHFRSGEEPLALPSWACATCGTAGAKGSACASETCSDRGATVSPVPWTLSGRSFDVEEGLTRPLGASLMNRYLLAFELASVLLLAALVGAAFLARKEVKE